MRPRDYLLDRLPLLAAFAAALVVLLLVVHLAYRPLRLEDVGYIVLLAVIAAAAILAVDHQRHRAFRAEVARRLGSREDLAAPLPRAASRELRAMAALLQTTSAAASGDAQRLRADAERHRAFIDLWVHQMKTPLAVLELTARQHRAGGAGEAWRGVAEEVDALAHGLDLMLASARLDRFELDLRPELTDLGVAARTAVNDLKSAWIRSEVYPRVTTPGPAGDELDGGGPAAVTAETDPLWLQVILRQLLTNAIKYSHAGSHVDVTVEPHGSGARITVADTGVGIPPEDVPRVFDRFFTGANGRLGRASTGMGLYLAAEVCRRLGHELSLESAVGKGTTARLTIAPEGLHRFAGDGSVRSRAAA